MRGRRPAAVPSPDPVAAAEAIVMASSHYAASVSLAVGRLVAVSMCVLAFAGRLAETFWVRPVAWRVEPTAVGVLISLMALAGGVAVPLLLYRWLLSPQRRRPADLRVDALRSRFVVPSSLYLKGMQAIIVMWIGAGGLVTERVPNGYRVRLAEFEGAIPISIAMVTLCTAAAVTLLFLNRPNLTLTPAGLAVRWLGRRVEVSWADLLPGGPPPPAKTGMFSKITLYFGDPGRTGTLSTQEVPVGQLGVDPAFLAGVIRLYAEQPERRQGIGTEAELARLREGRSLPG